jgi:tRNA nucleotidyltransferase (CCA-adding enzyme)
MGARAGGSDARALLAGSPRIREAVPLLAEAAEPGQRVALVGGVVRDLLRGEEPHEVDVVVEGDGIAFAKRLGALTSSEVRTYPAFGTATVRSRPPVDVVTARTETYAEPGALPTVAPATLEEDLRRRDFTVNAIAAVVAGPDAGALLDPYDGVAAVAAKSIALLRPDAFEEDATRLVRAARYAARLEATPDATLVHAAKAAAHGGFVQLTGQTRMVDAMCLVFEEQHPAPVIALLSEWGVLDAIEPGVRADPADVAAAWTIVEDEARDADRVALGFGLLLAGVEPERRREWLLSSGLERNAIRSALAAADAGALRGAIAGRSDGDVDEACARVPIEAVIAAGGDEAISYLARLRHIALAVDGADVKQVAGAEGAEVGRLLIALRRACIDGSVAGDRDAQLAWLAAQTD